MVYIAVVFVSFPPDQIKIPGDHPSAQSAFQDGLKGVKEVLHVSMDGRAVNIRDGEGEVRHGGG